MQISSLPTAAPTSAPTVRPGGPVYNAPSASNKVALTFDDGPNGWATDAILDTLGRNGVKGTFFVCGRPANTPEAGDRLRRMRDEGHTIGNHSFDHKQLPQLDDGGIGWQLRTTSDIVQRETGLRPDIFRPPYGEHNANVNRVAAENGMRNILWDVDTRDWARPGSGAIVNSAVNDARNGSIILMHDGGGNREQTVAAVEQIIHGLRGRGFELVTVPQLLEAGGV